MTGSETTGWVVDRVRQVCVWEPWLQSHKGRYSYQFSHFYNSNRPKALFEYLSSRYYQPYVNSKVFNLLPSSVVARKKKCSLKMQNIFSAAFFLFTRELFVYGKDRKDNRGSFICLQFKLLPSGSCIYQYHDHYFPFYRRHNSRHLRHCAHPLFNSIFIFVFISISNPSPSPSLLPSPPLPSSSLLPSLYVFT